MEIKHDKSYLNLNQRMVDAGFTNEVVGKICVQGSKEEKHEIELLLDLLETNFKMCQYKKDNGVKYGAEELFYWGDRERYFDVTIHSTTLEEHNDVVGRVMEFINNKFKNTNFYVRLQYDNKTDWDAINKFMEQDFDVANLPLSILGAFYNDMQYSGNKYSKVAVDKLHELSKVFLSQYIDKKVVVNDSLKGTIRKLDNSYGLFKPRATKTYYPMDIGVVKTIKFA